MTYKSVPQECPTKLLRKSVLQECPTRVTNINVPQERADGCAVDADQGNFISDFMNVNRFRSWQLAEDALFASSSDSADSSDVILNLPVPKGTIAHSLVQLVPMDCCCGGAAAGVGKSSEVSYNFAHAL